MMRPADLWPSLQRTARFELFEERLALSGEPLGDFFLDLGEQLEHHYGEVAPALADVHDTTGVNYVRDTYGFTGAGQTVAIIDSGIAYDHYALGGGFGSGYRVVGGWDFAEGDGNPYDDGPAGFHGTHVAGIVGSDSSTYEGVAPNVDLVALRVFDDSGAGWFTWVEDALQWVHNNRDAFDNPITTVNLSIGSNWNSDSVPYWSMLEDEFAQLENDGVFISVSAGNSFQTYNTTGLSYPAASPYVVPVASVDNDGSLSYFSQRSSRVLAAPGSSITSTVPDYLFGADGVPNDFGTASGTSMAAPYLAGASVLVREAMESLGYQNITQDTIYNHLRNTADVFHDFATNADYHRIDVQAAMDALMAAGGSDSDVDLVQRAYDLDQQHGLRSTGNYYQNWGGQNEKWMRGNGGWYFILADGGLYRWDGGGNLSTSTRIDTLDASYHADPSKLHDAPPPDSGGSGDSGSDVADRAQQLDQQLGLRYAGSYYQNWGGQNEKWMRGNDGWYFILADGQFCRWDGGRNLNTSARVDTLDASYHADPGKLHDASTSGASIGAWTASLEDLASTQSREDVAMAQVPLNAAFTARFSVAGGSLADGGGGLDTQHLAADVRNVVLGEFPFASFRDSSDALPTVAVGTQDSDVAWSGVEAWAGAADESRAITHAAVFGDDDLERRDQLSPDPDYSVRSELIVVDHLFQGMESELEAACSI